MPVNVKSEDNGIAAPPVGMMNVEDDDALHPVTSTAPAAAVSAIMHDDDDDDHDDDDMDDDPIVREVDVYLSPALADQIYLLQYPLQQTPLKLPTAARIKPRHAQMELDFPILPVVGGVGQQAHGGGAFPFMKSRVFQSQTIPVETHMCLGQLQIDINDNDDYTKSSLHLVPLQHISQMRPSFRHVEENADPDAAAVEDGDDHHHDQDDYVNPEAAAEKKPIVFQRKESERAAMIRKSSYAYKKASHDAEEWQDLIVCDAKSPEYRSNLQQILVQPQPQESELILAPLRNKADNSDNTDDSIDNADDQEDWAPPNMNYIQSLNYVKVSAHDEDMARAASNQSSTTGDNAGGAMTADNVGSSSSSNSDIKNIIARMTVLLGNGGPIPYSILRDQFVTSTAAANTATGSVSSMTDAKLFQALSICAVLVRGNFCLHSKFLSLSKSMQRARTFLLLLFQKYQTVQKSRLRQIDLQLLHLDDTTPSTSSSKSTAQQQQQQQVVTLDKLHVLLQQVGKRTNAVVNAVDYNPNHHHHQNATTSANSAAAPGWVLRVEDNLAFVAVHPQEAAQHLMYWNRLSTASPRIKQLLEQYNNATINGGAATADDTNDDANNVHDDSDSMMQY